MFMSFVVAYACVNRPALATTTPGPISHCVEDLGRPIAYLAVDDGTPVYDRSGEREAPGGRLEAALRRAWDWVSGVR
jgi:hypothetical protein